MIAVVPVMLIRLDSWFIEAAIMLQRNAASIPSSCSLLSVLPFLLGQNRLSEGIYTLKSHLHLDHMLGEDAIR